MRHWHECWMTMRTGLPPAAALERVKGIEPSSSAWEAAALPLSYTRAESRQSAAQPPLWMAGSTVNNKAVANTIESRLARRNRFCEFRTMADTVLYKSIAFGAVLALGACSGNTSEADQSEPDGAPTVTSRLEATGAFSPQPAETSEEVTAIPAQFLGVWDSVEGNCRAASDLRMDVRPREIEFYESLGSVEKVTVESPQAALITLDMAGEGETWQVINRFVLSEGGARLVAEPVGGNDGNYNPMPLKKCLAEARDA